MVNALLCLSQMMVNTLITLYADDLGATSTVVGLVVTLFAYTASALKVVSAPAIDSFNRKYLRSGAAATIAASYCLSAVSPVSAA